eukprot:CAMPEP_0172476260 /NCGR_PEP_ID=MMETSP1065-20121228/70287_1 /TAXON_ID=265537 /ORGANISM="Amphiprora paludosa, Strain CCMP125" /LENGTH=144 /DNA_ID=CAMNT_0013234481 /DNA_START=966 /DNA_END=1400 /DNA_ORIENTATION=+
MEDYATSRELPMHEMARFRRVADRGCNCDQTLIVDPAERPLEPLIMDRGRADDAFIMSSLVRSSHSPSAVGRPVGSAVMERGSRKGSSNVDEPYEEEPGPVVRKKKKKKKQPAGEDSSASGHEHSESSGTKKKKKKKKVPPPVT